MIYKNKILSIEDLKKVECDEFVICYGHFNLVHPGHLRYLHHAKNNGKKLIVAVRSDKDLDKENFGKHYNEIDRSTNVANIQLVDIVIVLDQISLGDLIKLVKPSFLVFGNEFKLNPPFIIQQAVNIAKEHNTTVDYHAGDIHYSNSDLLHDSATEIERLKNKEFLKICENYNISLQELLDVVDSYSKIRLLIIGDTIVDNYVACDAVGMSAEAPVLVVEEIENKEFIGGAAIVASHVRSLGANCDYISVVGNDEQYDFVKKTLNNAGIITNLIVDENRPTTYKTRYMVENQKLFRVSKIKSHHISEKIEDAIIDRLLSVAESIDGIMISDFVYGVITPKILDAITSIAKRYNIKLFGDLQCSSQVGNVTKFKEFDLITPTEKEARVALNNNDSGIEWLANSIIDKTKSKNILIKLGSNGFIAYANRASQLRQNFPALTVNPIDVAGAGDSLFSAMSLSISSNADLIKSSLIGTCMASLAVQEVGNIPITREKLINKITNIMSEGEFNYHE